MMSSMRSRIVAAEKARGIDYGEGRPGIDNWNGRFAFVLTLQGNDQQDIGLRVFRPSPSDPEPHPVNFPIAATWRMRLWGIGRWRWRRNDETPAFYYWLRDHWESGLVLAGCTLPPVPEVQELRSIGLGYLLEQMRFHTLRCRENHEKRLKGYGTFAPEERAVVALSPEERAGHYRKECGLTTD